MERWVEFIGHFHPAFVHFPVGILLLSSLLMLLSAFQKVHVTKEVIKLILIIGAVSAVLSATTGFMLSQSGEYDSDTLSVHQWMGIATAIVSSISCFFISLIFSKKEYLISSALVISALVSVAGHWGGSLTHGSNYLSLPSATESEEVVNLSSINLDSARFYSDMIKPILKSKCYSCHGPEKQKGKLRLDEKEFILRGGKNGEALIAGKPNDSELISRVELDISNKEHMPPKEKSQLTNQEKEIVKLWIESGADFELQVAKANNFQKIKSVISSSENEQNISDIPDKKMKAADELQISKLIEQGIAITPVASESPYLSVSLISIPNRADKLISELKPIRENIVWLKLSGTNLTDNASKDLSQFINVTRLSLDETLITDEALKSISTLKELQFLNLKGTTVSVKGLENLKDLKLLKSLFLYQTKVDKKNEERIRELFPQAEIDFGNYFVPTLESDTSIVKVK
jgi:uncharacterized membrane protein